MLNSGDTAFILVCAALVFLMTPGLAFFYGGLVRRKNVINTMLSSVFVMGTGIVMWILFGYSLSFGGSGSFIGNFEFAGFSGVGMEPGPYADTIPHSLFAAFQMMFAVITPAILTGGIAGRMRFKSLFIFIILWSVVVYYPLAHMVWGNGGFIAGLGSIDFAGGNVVHISSGVSALVLAVMIGKRKNIENKVYTPHNIPFVLLGAALLWFGWFGFNAGSSLAADGLAAHAFVTTAVAAACALLSWMLIERILQKKPTLVGASTGLVVGLVAITPGAGFVPLWAAVVIGLLVSPICFFAISYLKVKLGYDDALDAFGCHGIGGIFGGIMAGLFADASINGVDGLVYGGVTLPGAQILGILVTIAVAVVGTFVCGSITRLFGPLRVSDYYESLGLDASEHGESAYPAYSGMDS